MTRTATPTTVREAIERLAAAPLPLEEFQWQAAAELRRAVAFDSLCWTLLDPVTKLPSWVIADNPVIAVQQRLLHRLGPDPEESVELTGRGVCTLSAVTGGDLAGNQRWRELCGPGNLGDELSALLIADGRCWGALHLYRDEASRWFTDTDADTVARLSTLLGGRLRASLTASSGAQACTDGPGTIILDRDLNLVANTPAARRWLDRLPPAVPGGPEPLPGFVYALAVRADRPEPIGGLRTAPARLRIRARDGTWLVLHASLLSDSAALGAEAAAVTIEPAAPGELRPLLMRAHRLTAREREVAALVLGGLPNPEVAGSLYITRHTVTDHLKAIYAKVGVSNRSGLAAALSGQPLPAQETGPR